MATNPQNQGTSPGTIFEQYSSVITRLKSLVGEIWKVFIFSSLYLSVIAAAEVYIVMELLSLPLNVAPVVAAFLTFAVYGTDRIEDLETDMEATPLRANYVERYENHLYVLSSGAYGLAVALSVVGGPIAFGLSLLPGAVWLLYARDWIPEFGGQSRRFKEIFLLNSLLVATAWSAVIVYLPIVFVGGDLTVASGIIFAFFVLATFVNTEIPNIRDMEADRAISVQTLPVVLGIPLTRQFLYGITGFTAVLVSGAFVEDIIGLGILTGLLITLGCLTGLIACLGRVENIGGLSLLAEFSRLPILFLALVSIV